MKDQVLAEAKRLHKLGAAIHWLHPKSKRPIESKWTTGPRKDWDYLKTTYMPGLNVGVRLGTPSKIAGAYLGVVDVDVKSKNPAHLAEALDKLKGLIGGAPLPEVTSGRGLGSRHYYVLTKEPLKPYLAFQSTELVKVAMPSSGKPSRRETEQLTSAELAEGIRLRPAWEIGVMGDGQQVVLPPSTHPDSGKAYQWRKPFDRSALLALDLKLEKPVEVAAATSDKPAAPAKIDNEVKEPFVVVDVDLSWLPISDTIKKMILTGEGAKDRSAMLLPVCSALVRAGLTRNEVLSVLTDTKNYMGGVGYDHAKTSDRTRAARWLYRYTLAKVWNEASAEAMFREPVAPVVVLSKEEILLENAGNEKLRHWTDDLDLTKDDKFRTTLRNTVLILKNATPGVVRRDLFANRDFYGISTPWDGEQGKVLKDEDVSKIKLWLSNQYGMEPNGNTISEALAILAGRNSFDPVLDWIKALPPWDETPRLDTWLKVHFHAKGSDEYLAQVFRKWVVAMVGRVLEPGLKFDWMPIFEGAQGIGKSSFGRLLVGDEYFTDWLPDLENKDAALALQGSWAVEMGELAVLRKTQIEGVKAFISRQIDKLRPPYGERTIHSFRRCVFFGTTNNATYLKDESGNRRFKPVEVGRLDFNVLKKDREQLFAEALWLWTHGFETAESLDLVGEALTFEAKIHAEKMVQDDSVLMQDNVAFFIEKERQKPADETLVDFTKFRLIELFNKEGQKQGRVYPLSDWHFGSWTAQLAAKALKGLGFEKFKSDGVVYWRKAKTEKGYI